MSVYLPETWRFLVYNKDTGVTLDFSSNSANESATVAFRQTDGTGTANHDGSQTTHSASTDLASGSYEALTTVTGEDDIELQGYFEVITDNASASGDVILCVESSPDGGTTWPSDAANFDPEQDADIVKIFNFSGAETNRGKISYPY